MQQAKMAFAEHAIRLNLESTLETANSNILNF